MKTQYKRILKSTICVGTVFVCFATHTHAADTSASISSTDGRYEEGYYIGPDAVDRLLQKEKKLSLAERLKAWKTSLKKDYGFDIGIDYHAVGFYATQSPGKQSSASGVLRLFGEWQMLGKGTNDSGSLVFKIEHRHAYTDVSPVDFGGEIGYGGLLQSTFSDQRTRVTNLYWKQHLFDSRMLIFAGFMDVTDYTDVYLTASPWDGFGNLAFATGSATIGSLPDGALGIMVSGWVTDTMYAVASIADANADPTDLFGGFDTLFSDGETYKSLELGWTTGKERLFYDNFHITFWQVDKRKKADVPSGKGVSFSWVDTVNDHMMLFVRGGHSDGGGSILETSLSVGMGYLQKESGNVIGLGINWGQPNKEVYGNDAEDQGTMEIYYRMNTKYFQVTPSVQLIANPVSNNEKNFIAVFGLRIGAQF